MSSVLVILLIVIAGPAQQAIDPIENILRARPNAKKQNEFLKTSQQFSEGARSAKPTIEDEP